MNNKKRFDEIDILKGIGIILMILDHVYFGKYVHLYIQSFHMPLFFIVSGYLWNENYSIKERAKKRARSLMIPYICFGVLYLILYFAVYGVKKDNIIAILFLPTDMKNMPFAPALWFFPCMFLTDIVYTTIMKKTKSFKIGGVIIVLIATIGGIYSSISTVMLPFAIEPTMTALLFWYIGNCLKRYSDNNRINGIMNMQPKVLSAVFLISVVFAFLNKCVDMRSARYYIVPLYFFNGIFGTIVYWNIAKYIKKVGNINKYTKKIVNIIKYFGKNSMAFICMNQILIFLSNKIVEKSIINNLIVLKKILALVLVFMAATVFDKIISSSKMKFLLGK